MNQKMILKNSLTQDQIKNRKFTQKSIEHKSISLSFRNTEFFHRQQIYDDIYQNISQFRSEQFKCQKTQKENKESKFKQVIESAKSKFTSSPNYQKNNIIKQQQISIQEIAKQLRKQKRDNKVQLKNSDKSIKKINQLNLNLFLIITISLICYVIVHLEMIKPERLNLK